MAQRAYVGINEDNHWTLYSGDGTEAEQVILAVGPPFEPGPAIQEVLRDLQQWAIDNGYELVAPRYDKRRVAIQDVIEPEIYDEVFGASDEEQGDSDDLEL